MITTALKKIQATLYEPTFYKVIQGGARAGKTYAIMTLLIAYAESYPRAVVTVVGLSYTHLRDGAIRDFKAALNETGRWNAKVWNRSSLTYTFDNQSVIEFRSIDKMGAHGLSRDVLFVNEAYGIQWETFNQLAFRTTDFCIIDFNPNSKFWAHTELVEKQPEKTSYLILTYADNEAIPKQVLENILAEKPKEGQKPSNWWTVYGLGQIGTLEGNIYEGWEEVNGNDIVLKGNLKRFGLDFGFSNDETALVGIYELGTRKYGLVERFYQTGLLGSQYPEMLKRAGVDKDVLIIADSARPEIIAEIKNAGYMIAPCDKGAGSVLSGIDKVKSCQIQFAGANLRREYLGYRWRTKKNGETVDVPEDGHDHLMDAIRYGVADLFRQPLKYGSVRFD